AESEPASAPGLPESVRPLVVPVSGGSMIGSSTAQPADRPRTASSTVKTRTTNEARRWMDPPMRRAYQSLLRAPSELHRPGRPPVDELLHDAVLGVPEGLPRPIEAHMSAIEHHDPI